MNEPAEEQPDPKTISKPSGVPGGGVQEEPGPFELVGPDDGWECPVLFKRPIEEWPENYEPGYSPSERQQIRDAGREHLL